MHVGSMIVSIDPTGYGTGLILERETFSVNVWDPCYKFYSYGWLKSLVITNILNAAKA